MIKNSFITRCITAIVFTIVLLILIFLSKYSFLLLFTIIGFTTIREFTALFKAYIDKFLKILIFIFSLIIIFLFISSKLYFNPYSSLYFYYLLAFVIIIINIIFLIVNLFNIKNYGFQSYNIAMFSLLYICIPFVMFMDIAFVNGNYNPFIIFTIILLIWVSDTGAYIIGRLIGKRPLFKSVSPNKTFEGFIGGLLTTLLAAIYLSFLLEKELEIIGKFALITIGLIISIFGPIGDLIESKIKRFLQVKDSGNILPGHGGLLDRFDALLLVAPIVKFYLIVYCKI